MNDVTISYGKGSSCSTINDLKEVNKLSSLETLTSPILIHILSFLKAWDYFTLRECSSICNNFFLRSADPLWSHVLQSEFGFDLEISSDDPTYYLNTLRIGPKETRSRSIDDECSTSIFGYTASKSITKAKSPYESVRLWRKADWIFHNPRNKDKEWMCIHGPCFLRAATFWEKIERWLHKNSFHVLLSLSPGATKEEGFCKINSTECARTIEGIYAFHNGQTFTATGVFKSALFGSLHVYNHEISMVMRHEDCYYMDKSMIPLSSSIIGAWTSSQKIFYLDTIENAVKMILYDEYDDSIRIYDISDSSSSPDVGLRWFEEYARRLENNELTTLSDGNVDYIHPFPQPPSKSCSVTITRGIQVIASSISALEVGSVAYSIRIRIMLPGEDGYLSATERGFETCQLKSRVLSITDVRGKKKRVQGAGVIGRLPLFAEGKFRDDTNLLDDDENIDVEQGHYYEGDFIYESLTDDQSEEFSGKFLMIPGSLENPTGDEFYVTIAPFSVNPEPHGFRYF